MPFNVVGKGFVVTSFLPQMALTNAFCKRWENGEGDLSSPEILAEGSSWQETHLVASSVCLLKLELSAENLWSTCET